MDVGELIVLCEQVMFVLLRSLGEKVASCKCTELH